MAPLSQKPPDIAAVGPSRSPRTGVPLSGVALAVGGNPVHHVTPSVPGFAGRDGRFSICKQMKVATHITVPTKSSSETTAHTRLSGAMKPWVPSSPSSNGSRPPLYFSPMYGPDAHNPGDSGGSPRSLALEGARMPESPTCNNSVVGELRELSARMWTRYLCEGGPLTTAPSWEDLENSSIQDFKLGSVVETTSSDLLWTVAAAEEPLPEPEPRTLFYCRLRKPIGSSADSPLFNSLYPMTMHCLSATDPTDPVRVELEHRLRRYFRQSCFELPTRHPNVMPLLRLMEGPTELLEFDGLRHKLPHQTLSIAITPAYRHTLAEDITRRSHRCAEARLTGAVRSKMTPGLFSEEVLLFYTLQVANGAAALQSAGLCLRHLTPDHVLIQQDDALVWGDLLRMTPLCCHPVDQLCPRRTSAHGFPAAVGAMLAGETPASGVTKGLWGPEAAQLLERSLATDPTADDLRQLAEAIARWLWRDLVEETEDYTTACSTPVHRDGSHGGPELDPTPSIPSPRRTPTHSPRDRRKTLPRSPRLKTATGSVRVFESPPGSPPDSTRLLPGPLPRSWTEFH